jgi:type III pantothenate kinase
MNLVIDIGNTRSKLAIFADNDLVELKIEDCICICNLKQIISEYPQIKNCIISSVARNNNEIENFIREQNIILIILGPETSIPFKNNYSTKETLGQDRLAAIAGASKLFPETDVLVIDAGTAITFDIKNRYEEYIGGNISPGLEMRFKALHHFTAKLPLLSSEATNSCIGKSTKEAITNGVQNGIIFEIQGYIDTLTMQYPNLIVLLTGGDSGFFENMLKRSIFVNPNLILTGLNAILEHNV